MSQTQPAGTGPPRKEPRPHPEFMRVQIAAEDVSSLPHGEDGKPQWRCPVCNKLLFKGYPGPWIEAYCRHGKMQVRFDIIRRTPRRDTGVRDISPHGPHNTNDPRTTSFSPN